MNVLNIWEGIIKQFDMLEHTMHCHYHKEIFQVQIATFNSFSHSITTSRLKGEVKSESSPQFILRLKTALVRKLLIRYWKII